MTALRTQIVFTVAGHAYDWADVVLAAKLWEDWPILEVELQEGLACVKRVEDTGEEVDPDHVEAAANEFRYERDLLTADETEAWLARSSLTADAWMDYIERSVLRAAWADKLPEIVATYPVGADEMAAAIDAEGLCSGRFAIFARKLAGRVAVSQRMREEGGGESLPEGEGADVIAAHEPAGVDPGACGEKVAMLTRLERSFHRFRGQVLTPQAVRDAVGVRRLDWIRLHCRSLSFPGEEMAREAALCIRDDGAELAEVGRAAQVPAREGHFFIDEMAPGSRDTFVSAATGDLLGPLPIDGSFVLMRVLEKILPSVEDPAVRQRAEQEILRRAVEHEIDNRVGWQILR